MKELEYLEVINKTLADSSLLGDDCAVLPELGLCVTQDTLVEDVHFSLKTTTPFELAQKAVNVNLSDLAAAGALPLYITISLSLPKSAELSFVKEFYRGIETACAEYFIKVAGGDLTGSDKVFISICAIGKKDADVNISRRFAKAGDVVVTTGCHGDSAGGLNLLMQGENESPKLIESHLLPRPQIQKSKEIVDAVKKAGIKEFAMMDTSDGLGDAVFKISKASNVTLDIDFGKVPVSNELKAVFPDSYKDLVMWGGEDFELLFTVPEKVFDMLDSNRFFKIGAVKAEPLTQEMCEQFHKKSFKHFEEN